ncbi:hypothetical protein [Pseudomonas syringae group genomosp. 3]|uniref:hypothetical protein n=1 Tax=Pseudomonas syringae group genomosp. 3 TaxID=251701 RepID=UPI0006E5A684|nr:hypothetical protein [Pseudomonas syringae group genomosp. 3]KPW61370.1 Unknown protein sequence [Pseudomonas syringae pv. berberidis]KPY17225.1 Unknown protein sequence [Pseudomonas syringae pv. philadelphi]RMM15177.1 hypothetical protein ALQ83_01116 [Pseudomonas syringae pv. berberidis]RMP64489.1 hypothetical protein ALQ19_00239 [Pseudomonas syringae pv. berberidis]
MREDTVFARCVALDGSELLHERQIGRWSLMGDFVLCTQCLAAQSIGLAQEPFEHLDDCVASQYGLHPWHELARLLSQIPPLAAETQN